MKFIRLKVAGEQTPRLINLDNVEQIYSSADGYAVVLSISGIHTPTYEVFKDVEEAIFHFGLNKDTIINPL